MIGLMANQYVLNNEVKLIKKKHFCYIIKCQILYYYYYYYYIG